MKYVFAQFAIFLMVAQGFSQSPEELYNVSKNKTPEALRELKDFLHIPNDALNATDIRANISWLTASFFKRGFEIRVLPTSGTPLFFAKRTFNGADKTVLFYMHFDGQAVDPAKWDQPDPYEAVIKKYSGDHYEIILWEEAVNKPEPDWRVFGRSASDDKGPIIMFLSAIDLLDKEFNGMSGINIKVILDGEEEKGSRHLEHAVVKYKNILKADYMVINDGPMHLSGKPTLIYGCRGITGITLTVYGPRTHQHSGHYGNYAPNPVFRMAELLAGMKDEEGRVTIPGYYDGIELGDHTLKILNAVPDDPALIHKTIGISEPEKVGRNYQESLQYPSLNVRGIEAAWVGKQARTIVPEKAVASIDIRLVPESDPDRLKELIKTYIEEQGYSVTDRDPTEKERLTYSKIARFETFGTTLPFRTDIQSEIGEWLIKSIQLGMESDPVNIRIMGGTVPVAGFINELKVPAVIVPLVNADNNQHSPNENLRIWNLTNGIQTFLALIVKE